MAPLRSGPVCGRPYLARAAEEHSGPHMPWFWQAQRQSGRVLSDMTCHFVCDWARPSGRQTIQIAINSLRKCGEEVTAQRNFSLHLRFGNRLLRSLLKMRTMLSLRELDSTVRTSCQGGTVLGRSEYWQQR